MLRLAAFAIVACLVDVATIDRAAGDEAARAATRGRRVVLVGLDGADWQAIDPLVQAGRLPAFARLRSAGRTGTMLATPPLLSPILWTTIATGRRPEDHGILDFMVDLPDGGQAPVPSTQRRVAALWNVFSEAGRRVDVVGWWATWPAEDVRGTIVSDRLALRLLRGDEAIRTHAISPSTRAAELESLVAHPGALTRDELDAYVALSASEHRAAREALQRAGATAYRDPIAHLSAIVAETRTCARIADALVGADQPDLLLVYLEVIDAVSHRFVRDPRRGPRAIARAYEDADALIGRLAARVAPDTWIVVVSDHGFYATDAGVREDPADLEGPASAWHRPYGIVAAAEARHLSSSGATTPAADAGTLTPLDIAPTVLHVAGLPISRAMPGRVQVALLPADAAARPIERVATFERARPGPSAAPPRDEDALERLRALGYVGGATSSLARRNLGEILYRRGDLPGAERELRAVVDRQPDNVPALLWLAKAVRDQGRSRAALQVYEQVLAQPGDNGDALVAAVDLAAQAQLPAEARRLAEGPWVPRVSRPAASVARAIAARAAGQPDVAERELRAALLAEPTYLPALVRLLDAGVDPGRAERARGALDRAAAAAPRSPTHLALAGEGALVAGDFADAERRLQGALRLAPDADAVRLDLARAQLGLGSPARALATLAGAAESVQRSVLLGVAHTRAGAWAEAARHYREALDQGEASPDLLNGLAWVELKLGRRLSAASLLERSLSVKRDQPEAARLLAEVRQGLPR